VVGGVCSRCRGQVGGPDVRSSGIGSSKFVLSKRSAWIECVPSFFRGAPDDGRGGADDEGTPLAEGRGSAYRPLKRPAISCASRVRASNHASFGARAT
jgi:hypothetical protein